MPDRQLVFCDKDCRRFSFVSAGAVADLGSLARPAGLDAIGIPERMRGQSWSGFPPTGCVEGEGQHRHRSLQRPDREGGSGPPVRGHGRRGNRVSGTRGIRADPEHCQDAWEGDRDGAERGQLIEDRSAGAIVI